MDLEKFWRKVELPGNASSMFSPNFGTVFGPFGVSDTWSERMEVPRHPGYPGLSQLSTRPQCTELGHMCG